MSVSVVFSVDHVNSFHVRDFPFKVWVGGSSIFSEETKHPPRLHSHPCFLYFAVCAGSQPAIVDSFNLVATIPKALFKKGVAAFEPFISPDFDFCDLHNMFTCDVVCELLYFVASTSTSSNKKHDRP